MKYPDMRDVIQLYLAKIGPLSGAQRDKLYQAYDEGMEPFVIGCAILRAKQQQRKNQALGRAKNITFNYVWKIIEDWLAHNVVNEESFKVYWQAIRQESVRSENYAKKPIRKVTRDDFKYSVPERPKKGTFSFLDE